MRVKKIAVAVCTIAALLVAATGCGAPNIPKGDGVVSQNIVELEADERLNEICVRLNSEPKVQYCQEDVSDKVARSCVEGAQWPKCRDEAK